MSFFFIHNLQGCNHGGIFVVIIGFSFIFMAAGQLVPSNCRISWLLTLNSYTIGGVDDTSSTIDQCLNRCLTDLSCRGVQVRHLVSEAVQCWRFYSDNFNLMSTLVAGYDQYTLQARCVNTTDCAVKWQYWENTKFQATGYLFSGITVPQACLATCVQTVGCIGVDIKKTTFPIQCYIHFNSSSAGNVLFTQEYDQYLLLDACVNGVPISSTVALPPSSTAGSGQCWNTTAGTLYFNLTQINGINTVDACKAYCVNLPQCWVISYDNSASPCWVQTVAGQLTQDNVYQSTDVTTYFLDRNCLSSVPGVSTVSPGTTGCWNTIAGTQYFLLNQYPYYDVSTCQNFCQFSLPVCTIINIDPSTSPPCWVQDFPGPLNPENFGQSTDITTYTLDRNCNPGAGSSLFSSGMPSVTGPVDFPNLGCWSILPLTRHFGLTQSPYYTLVSCENFCQYSLPQCSLINFDLDSNPPCWVQTTAGPFQSDLADRVNAFKLDRICGGASASMSSSSVGVRSTPPLPTIDICWTPRLGFQYYGLSSAPLTSESTCKDYCISLPECNMVDFVLGGVGPFCWVQISPMVVTEDNYYNNDNINNFRLNRTCLDIIRNQNVTTTTVSGPPTNCVGWTVLPSKISIDGSLQPTLRTLDSCQAGCVVYPSCLALDYDSIFLECYFHIDPAKLLSIYDSDTASQYRIQRNLPCNDTSGTSSTTVSGPMNCFTWTTVEKQVSINGEEQPSYTTLESCQLGCTRSTSCIAVDYDTSSSPSCWYHFNPSDLLDLYDNQFANQFRLQRNPQCTVPSGPPTCYTWTPVANKISINGDLLPAFHSLSSCQDSCTANPDCVAVDYDTLGSDNCWIHTDRSNLLDLYDSDTASQYRLLRDPSCSSVSTSVTTTTTTTTIGGEGRSCVSQSYSNTNSIGGSLVPGVTTDIGCWGYCLTTFPCVGVDFDPPGCWQHTDLGNFISTRKLNGSPGVTQYVISRNCNVPITIATGPSSISSGQGACVTATNYNTNSIGGSLVVGIATPTACMDYCLANPSCIGVDFDPQSGCWLHNNGGDFNDKRKLNMSPGITQFVVSHNCNVLSSSSSTSTTTAPVIPPSCPPSFQVFFNTSSSGGSNQEGLITPLSCLWYCLDFPDACAALDFDIGTGCWIHLDRVEVDAYRKYPSEGVTQFVMERSCNLPLSVCSFQALNNTASSGGLLVTEVKGPMSCLRYCLVTPTCVAVDLDGLGNCFAHSNTRLVLANRRQTPGTNQFVLNRVNCLVAPPPTTLTLFPWSSSTYSSSTASPSFPAAPPSTSSSTGGVSTSASLPPPACPPTWTMYEKTYSLNGIRQSQYNSRDACLDGCARDLRCYGVDVEDSGVGSAVCFFHMDPNFAQNVFTALPSTSQYRIYRSCIGTGSIPGECQSWGVSLSTNSIDGVHYFQFTNLQSCQLLCVNLPSCVAVDFDTRSSTASYGCWVHNSLQELVPDNTFATDGINQYILNRVCPGTCSYSWIPYPDNSMVAGIPQRDTTLQGCQDRCINVPGCTGIDVDTRPGYVYCWLHLNTDFYLFPTSGVNHYQLTRGPDCPESRTTTSIPGLSTTSMSLSTSCVVKMILGENADGGQRLSDPVTNETCALQCLSLFPQCIASDWRISDSACFIHNSLSGRKPSPCCTRYEIVCNSTQGTQGCQDDFIVNQNMLPNLQGLVYQPSATSVEQCQTSCLNNGQSCIAVVFSAIGRVVQGQQSCYLVTSLSALNTAEPSNDFDLYSRRFCQPYNSGMVSTTPYPTPPSGYCLLDIVFLIDTSGSIQDNQAPGVNNMQLIRSFLQSFLTISSDVGFYFDHMGIVTFDTVARVVYDLCDRQTPYSINATGIYRVVQSLGTTNTPMGFDTVYDMLFNPSRCARSSARPVVILITDAHTSPEFQPFYQNSLNKLINTQALRIALGVTMDVDLNELRQFSSPSVPGPYLLSSYSDLYAYEALIYNLMTAQCGRPTLATVPLPGQFSTVTTSPTPFALTSTTTSSTTTSSLSPTPYAGSTSFFVANQPIAFGAYLSNGVQGPIQPVQYDQIWATTQYGYQTQTWGFVSSGGLFFFDLGAGIDIGRKVTLSLMIGGKENRVFDWQSTNYNGLITSSRFMVLYLEPGQFVGVSLIGDSYLQSNFLTKYSSFSGFSIANAMSSLSNQYAFVAEPNLSGYPYQNENYTLPIISKVPSLAGNIVNGNSFVCPITGIYLFTMSSGVTSDQKTRISLIGLTPQIEITRLGTSRNGVTTMSRSALLNCPQGTRVTFMLASGELTDRNITSFSGFLVQNSGQGVNHAWGLYKSYNSDTLDNQPLDPFYYDTPAVNPLNLFNPNSRLVTIQLSGLYYLQVTAGVQKGFPLRMRLVSTSGGTTTTLCYLLNDATNTDGEEFLSHGLVTRLNAGDTLKVVADVPSHIYNTEYGYQTSFIGFYLYP